MEKNNASQIAGDDDVDYIKKDELESHVNNYKMTDGHEVFAQFNLAMSPSTFWDKYFADDAECFIMYFNEDKGELKI